MVDAGSPASSSSTHSTPATRSSAPSPRVLGPLSPASRATCPSTSPAPGGCSTLTEWNAVTHGSSLLVVLHGRIVHEWYAEGLGPDDAFLGASMTKSALAHLVGMAVT